MTTPPATAPGPVLTEADALIDTLLKALPRDLRALLGHDPTAQNAARDALLREGAAEVLAHLHGLEDDA
jgi:hypothetical protein